MRKLILFLVLTGCVTASDHPPQKRPDFSKPKETKATGCSGCSCAVTTKSTVAPVKS